MSQKETKKDGLDATRREFLTVLGAGLLICVVGESAVFAQNRRPRGGGRGGKPVAIGARIHIGKDGAVTVLCGKVEAGQGARAEITQAVAEELRVPVEKVGAILADTGVVPDDGITAGSGTTPRTIPAVRTAAAAAREILIGAAAKQWGVEAGACEVKDGKVVETKGKREIGFGELVAGDEKMLAGMAPEGVKVIAVAEWKVMGTAVSRPNGREIVTGAHHFPSDIQRPGMLYGKVLRAPQYGAKGAVPPSTSPVPGLVLDGDFIGVTGKTSLAAREAAEAIEKTVIWHGDEGASSEGLYEKLAADAQVPANPFGEVVKNAAKRLKSRYTVAYVQHAPLEPRAAVADWTDGKLTVWTGTQNPFGVRGELMKAFGLGEDSVRVVVPDFGGGFGGKHSGECAVEAARLAKAAGKPVSLRWTREEEFKWAYFRPAGVIDAEASLDEKGALTSWHFVNINSGPNAVDTPYKIPSHKSVHVPSSPPLRHGSYRGLAATANHFARECFMDEMAALAGADPLAFRLEHLEKGRLRDVLEDAAKRFEWTKRVKEKRAGWGVGLSCGTEKGSYVAACVEVQVVEKEIRVKRVVQTFECGKVVNPGNLMAQVQGAIVMGLGPALREGMEFSKGMITNASFSGYRVPRFGDVPALEVKLLDRPDLASAGAGETPIVCVAPAVGNAVFAATGVRVRSMPLRI